MLLQDLLSAVSMEIADEEEVGRLLEQLAVDVRALRDRVPGALTQTTASEQGAALEVSDGGGSDGLMEDFRR